MNSRSIESSQTDVHTELETVVHKHLKHTFQKPIGQPTREVFEALLPRLRSEQRPLLLDSGCGIGESTERLALMYPEHFVLGVDKSEHRLNKRSWLQQSDESRNSLIVRADLVDFWRLMAEHEIRPDLHFHLYPNPWPKPGHLQRRWQGHAVFPTLAELGGRVEMRSNWLIYLKEFALAWEWGTGQVGVIEQFVPEQPLTPFERKYHQSGQALYRLHFPPESSQQGSQ
jgi:tRNA (guanine-N7-)-methyltransferase